TDLLALLAFKENYVVLLSECGLIACFTGLKANNANRSVLQTQMAKNEKYFCFSIYVIDLYNFNFIKKPKYVK
ncbi:hypothetical protein, partial [Mycoplasmopsis bovis]|uniref:hypothetical protein n=1 Tax=Mycoplasmopsis bovis TaxID=28903 RepID=UPI003D2C44E0